MKSMRLKTLLALALPALLGAGALHVAVSTSASAAPQAAPKATPKVTPTPGTVDLTVPPAGGKARVPPVDLRPVSIILMSHNDTTGAYEVQVSYQCEADSLVWIAPQSVKVRPVASRYPDPVQVQPTRPCGLAHTDSFRCQGTELYEAIVDSASRIHESNEGNNTCTFSRASFASGRQYNCPH